jgi:hypothetical protein
MRGSAVFLEGFEKELKNNRKFSYRLEKKNFKFLSCGVREKLNIKWLFLWL